MTTWESSRTAGPVMASNKARAELVHVDAVGAAGRGVGLELIGVLAGAVVALGPAKAKVALTWTGAAGSQPAGLARSASEACISPPQGKALARLTTELIFGALGGGLAWDGEGEDHAVNRMVQKGLPVTWVASPVC